ncbi:MAG: DUF1573 domain-containing protein [Ignavibacteriae bacterium]|nr:DUF1573 domain-containing protein [Ignavibacteriota bacterium]
MLTCSLFVTIVVVSAQPKWALQVSGTSMKLNSVSFFDTLSGVAVGNNGIILRSINGGTRWTQVPSGTTYTLSSVVYSSSSIAMAADGGKCFDAGCGNIYRTTDGGASWFEMAMHGADYPSLSFVTSQKGIIAGGGYDFGGNPYSSVSKTTDGGVSWFSYFPLVNNQWFYKIMDDINYVDTTFCIAATGDGLILRHDRDTVVNSSRTSYWSVVDSLPVSIRRMFFFDTLYGTVVGTNGNIWRTTDGGDTWQQQISNTTQHLNSVYFLSVNEGYVAGNGGTILHTTNGGTTWTTELTGTTQHLNKILFTDVQHGWAVGDNGVILKYGSFTSCNLSRTTVDFGSINNKSEFESTIQIKNNGTLPLAVSSIVSDNSDFTANMNDVTVSAGGTANVIITFHPVTPGEKSGNIIFTHDVFPFADTVSVRGTSLDFDTTFVEVNEKWNLISNPRLVSDNSRTALFPSALTDAFQYEQGSGYTQTNTILNGRGYWLKFNSSATTKIAGVVITSDTIDVQAGWNLIGTISHPVTVQSILNVPEGIVTSKYFGFENGYVEATTIQPGRAYWVKANANGKLVLTNP